MSTQIEKERNEYYNQLEKQQSGAIDITNWLEWFLDCLERAIKSSDKILKDILLKTKLWQEINLNLKLNDRQCLIINRMLESNFKGYINTSKYAKITKCSKDTALRDILYLKDKNILLQNSAKGRSTSYRINKDYEFSRT